MLHTNLCTIRLDFVLVTGKMSLQKTFIASCLIVPFSYKSTCLKFLFIGKIIISVRWALWKEVI